MVLRLLGVLGLIVGLARAVPVDNGVEGDPEIECGPTSITVNFNTRAPFEGHVYVKGLYATPGCRNDEGGRQVAGITLPFDSCGINRQRSLNPRGVFVSTTIVVSFHPLFLTKVDRAYRIQCFYMEADKTVDSDLEVSMLTTGFRSEVVPMPICRYEILEGSPTGPVAQFAVVGQQVYHKWTCDTETVDTFCMVVHSCYVDDNNGDRVDLIGEDGCARDIYLLNNPEYPSDLMAGVEAHVFKYADRPQLYFQCQVAIFVKEPNAECPRPNCAPPAGRGGPRPAGALPPAPPNPFPLVPGSQYLPQPGNENPIHGPGDPAQPFAAHPGRPDPNTFHQPGARLEPVPGAQNTAPFRPRHGAAPRPFAPGDARPFDPGFNPGGTRRFFNDAPLAVDTQNLHSAVQFQNRRQKRQVEFLENAAGTVDVSTEMNALDMGENVELPESFARRFPTPGIRRSEDGLCFSASSFAVISTLIIVIMMTLATISTFWLMRQKK